MMKLLSGLLALGPVCALPLVAVCALPLVAVSAFAFDSITHEAITYSAFRHLDEHAHLSATTARWTSGLARDRDFMKDLLARATVDADYRDDVWADAAFHPAFTGASDGLNTGLSVQPGRRRHRHPVRRSRTRL